MLKLYFENGLFPDCQAYFKQFVKHEPVETNEECDYVISAQMKYGIYASKDIQKVLNYHKNSIKKVIVFLVSGSSDRFKIPDQVLFFRTSILKTEIKNNEYLLPYIFEKPLEFNILVNNETPKLGFCGQTQHNI